MRCWRGPENGDGRLVAYFVDRAAGRYRLAVRRLDANGKERWVTANLGSLAAEERTDPRGSVEGEERR